MLANDIPAAEILQDFPYLEPDDIRACLAYAAQLTGQRAVEPADAPST